MYQCRYHLEGLGRHIQAREARGKSAGEPVSSRRASRGECGKAVCVELASSSIFSDQELSRRMHERHARFFCERQERLYTAKRHQQLNLCPERRLSGWHLGCRDPKILRDCSDQLASRQRGPAATLPRRQCHRGVYPPDRPRLGDVSCAHADELEALAVLPSSQHLAVRTCEHFECRLNFRIIHCPCDNKADRIHIHDCILESSSR